MKKLDGYLAAPFTPMQKNGDLNLDLIPGYAGFLLQNGLEGVYLCGSTGEGALLTREERMAVAEKWVDACGEKMKIVVHTGGTSLRDQQALATHAEKIGAWAVAAMAPAFLPPKRNEELLDLCKAVAAAAPSIPFYYYHIPPLNRVNLSVIELLKAADKTIPNFTGVKYTSPGMHEFEQCRHVAGGKFEMLWGLDEMFLDGLVYGNNSGVGGTYNQCFSLYDSMSEAYARREMGKCRELQHKSHLFIDVLNRYRGNIMGGKRVMKFLGLDCGPNRIPLQSLSQKEENSIRNELEEIDFFDFCNTEFTQG
jgi:N-acetylneuraminate lyase